MSEVNKGKLESYSSMLEYVARELEKLNLDDRVEELVRPLRVKLLQDARTLNTAAYWAGKDL